MRQTATKARALRLLEQILDHVHDEVVVWRLSGTHLPFDCTDAEGVKGVPLGYDVR